MTRNGRDLLLAGLALVALVLIVAIIGVVSFRRQRSAAAVGAEQPVAASPPLVVLRSEDTSAPRVVDTVQLELGEGDDRAGTCEVRLKNGLGVHHVPVGTRIEQLEDDGRAPKGMRLIRVSTSRYHGIVGYAWAYQIQAAR